MEKFLKYGKPAAAFEEALPLGNGSLGAMVYGRVDVERISLNHDTLWSGKPGQHMVEGARESYEKAQKLTIEGKYYEAQKEIERNFTGPWLNSYLYLGALYIKRKNSKGYYSNYSRVLDLENSMAFVSYNEDGIDFEREYFVSYPDNCVMVRLKSSKPVTYILNGECIGKNAITAGPDTLYLSGECPAAISPNYDMKSRSVVYDGDGVKVSAMARVFCDGETECKENGVQINNSTDVTIYFCAETSFIAFDKLPNLLSVSGATWQAVSKILRKHQK